MTGTLIVHFQLIRRTAFTQSSCELPLTLWDRMQ